MESGEKNRLGILDLVIDVPIISKTTVDRRCEIFLVGEKRRRGEKKRESDEGTREEKDDRLREKNECRPVGGRTQPVRGKNRPLRNGGYY